MSVTNNNVGNTSPSTDNYDCYSYSDIISSGDYNRNYYMTNAWYNARDYCENCQHKDGELFPKCGNPSSYSLTSSALKRRRKARPSTICTVNCRYEIVREVADSIGMKEATEGWNVCWTDFSINHERCKEMKRYQRINHFPGMLEICRKDLLARNLNRMQKWFPDHYNFYPRSWCLPTELNEVLDYCKVHRNKSLIVKPDLGCQGRGIFITKNLNDLRELDRMICQVYISKPFLLDGYKFDLRVYVLITSCDPLRIFVYNEGLARFATRRYKEPSSTNISNMYMHLTNYSVNKHSRAYVNNGEEGSKRRISTVNNLLNGQFYNTEKVWKCVDDVIIKTVIVALPSLKHSYHACFAQHFSTQACFEILGFDFILDYKLNPFLLEVNHSPSFHTETDIDQEVKETLLQDTFRLLNLTKNDKLKILNEDRKRVKDRILGNADKKPLAGKFEEKNKLHEASMKKVFDWESTHLGNFRQIFPCDNERQYDAFMNINQSTLYSDTQSSKARETATKLHKDEIKIDSKSSIPAQVRNIPNIKKIIKDMPAKSEIIDYSSFDPEIIDEKEEQKRVADLKKRETVLCNHGVLEKIFNGMKQVGRLQLEDEIRFGRNNNWGYKNELIDEKQSNDWSKKKLEEIFKLLSQRGLLHTSQELSLNNTLIRMSSDYEMENFLKRNMIERRTENSPKDSVSSISLERNDDESEEQILNGNLISDENIFSEILLNDKDHTKRDLPYVAEIYLRHAVEHPAYSPARIPYKSRSTPNTFTPGRRILPEGREDILEGRYEIINEETWVKVKPRNIETQNSDKK